MSDGEGVWAHLVCKQTMPATGKSFQTGMGCFRMCTVVKKGMVEFSKGCGCRKGHGWVFNGRGCRNGHSWVFEQVWLSKRVGWVFKWAWLSWLGVEREPVVEIGTGGFQNGRGC